MNNLNNTELHFPELKPSLDNIINLVKNNITKKYRENENNLRINYYDKKHEKEEIEEYFRNLKLFDNYLIHIINKDEYLIKFLNSNQKQNKDFYNLLISDYYTIFLNNMIKKKKIKALKDENEKLLIIKNIENNNKFLNLMFDIRNKAIENFQKEDLKDNLVIIKIAKSINWIESYSEEIIILVKIFSKLNNSIPALYEYIEEIINNNKIQYKNIQQYFYIINETFFLSINSVLKIIYSKSEIYESPGSLLYLTSNIKEIIEDILQLENNLNLYPQEIITLQEISHLIDLMSENNLINLENIKNIFKYFEIIINNSDNIKILCDNLNNIYKFLITKIENKNSHFYKSINYLLIWEYKKNEINEFRELIIDIILQNNNFIEYSSEIFKNILDNIIDINQKEMINNIDKIKDEKSLILQKLNNSKNTFLDEVIINIFEGKIMIYFESIQDLDNNILEELYPNYLKDKKNLDIKYKNEKGIIFDTSFKIFEQIINFLDENSTEYNNDNNKQNMNICKLYSIAYLKIYLYKTISFIKDETKEKDEYKNILNTIQNIKNQNFKKVIKIYIFKLLYYFMNNNLEKCKTFNFDKYNIEFHKDFSSSFSQIKEITLKSFFLPLEDEDYKKYTEQLKLFDIIAN